MNFLMAFLPLLAPAFVTCLIATIIWPRKTKIQFRVDPDPLAKSQQQIRDLQDALRFYVDRHDEASEQLELAVARIEMFRRHKAEIVDFVEALLPLAHWIQDDRDTAEAEVVRLKELVEHRAKLEIEQLTVQMAGCESAAVKDQYVWSPSYQDVLELRMKYEVLREQCTALDLALFEIRTTTIDAKDPTASFYRLRSIATAALSDGE